MWIRDCIFFSRYSNAVRWMIRASYVRGGDPDMVNAWGVTFSFIENVPGQVPVHTPVAATAARKAKELVD